MCRDREVPAGHDGLERRRNLDKIAREAIFFEE